MQTKIQIAEREVSRAYSENRNERNLNFLSSVTLPIKDAQKVLTKFVPSYNEFKPSLLSKLPKGSIVRIGREYSPVIYVATNQTPDGKAMLANECDLHDCETDYHGNNTQIWRLWWD